MWTAKCSLCIFHKKKNLKYGRNDWKVHTTIIKHFFFRRFSSLCNFFLCVAGKILCTARSLDTWALCMNKKKIIIKEVWGNEKKRQQNVNKLMYIASTIEICDFILIPQLPLFIPTLLSLLGVNLTPFGIFFLIFNFFFCLWSIVPVGCRWIREHWTHKQLLDNFQEFCWNFSHYLLKKWPNFSLKNQVFLTVEEVGRVLNLSVGFKSFKVSAEVFFWRV